ncbi:hypothetical protein HMPREF9969_0799 [Prevotella sp. oral taxon 306 str. F0472]|uniref:hypothetical protein n=1 Tax=Prevotella sp. oral taxon 306 TaxID=712461 RepID=UPI00025BBF34|nr:hypothetical protein [Prevotella sp. oral taxon 306]EID32655.1 hypothetical protein HMPREF9969_0799 [Prevotella sp. oral taxon 306 str. F0472]
MKKTMKQHSFTSQLKSLAVVLGIALAFTSCANEDVAQNPTNPNEGNDKNLTTFVAGDETKTRTSLNYNSSDFYWEAGDYIYVKDDDGTLQKSSNAPTSKVASFKYKVPGKFTGNSYKVYYLGKNSSGSQVTISTTQTQTKPDNTEHFSTAGDYGTATATKVPNKQQFAFELEHQAAYLVFQPYTSNTILHNCYLTGVEVTSDNDIAETYTVNTSTDNLDASAVTGGKKIVLETKDPTSGSAYNNGFPLTSNTADVTTNGAYMVIKPGTHTLKVRYWVKDVATNVEGTITKTLPATAYASNTYYDMTANLNVRNYDGDKYYMWDAQNQYWYGYEWTKNLPAGVGQPTLIYSLPGATSSSNYPKSSSDPNNRWYNTSYPGNGISNPAIHSCKDLPNVNEMTWYAGKGDPRWDADELWTTMGHLYKGGMWFKKKSVLQAEHHYDTEKSVDGTDWRTNENDNNWSASNTLPSAADANKYFYLPALGCYGFVGKLQRVGSRGYYWSSTANPRNKFSAFTLDFENGTVNVISYNGRDNGFRVEPTFE